MKRISRVLGVFLCLAMVISGSAFAAGQKTIDVSNVEDGYFTVSYNADAELKMKVGVTFKGDTTYYDYIPGNQATYALIDGDGKYTITLYRNISGTTYKKVTSQKVTVDMEDELAPYLVSTTEITFSEEDAVGKKAAELCNELTEEADKVVAIHNYIAENFRYNYMFAAAVRRGAIKTYIPNTNTALEQQCGVCYDFSALFAAMCRSQGIPCAMAKGYTDNGYHAWNMVYLNEEWVAVDMTASIAYRLFKAETITDCMSSMDTYRDYKF